MDLISKKDVGRLADTRQAQCVSIYLPTERAGRKVRQNPIRLKNLLGQAEEKLAEGNMSEDDIRGLLKRVRRLLEDEDFWQHQSDGLAVFLTAELFQCYRLSVTFPELAVVTDRFHLKPLLPLITIDRKFYVLALSQNKVRVLRGSRHSVSELDIADVPASLAEALKYDDGEKSLQFRQGGAEAREGRAAGEGRAAIFHGHGAGDDEQKPRLLRFFQKIDRGLHNILAAESAPLILAGVEYYFPIYREASSYNYLLEEGIEGNPEHLDSEELHARAWKIVEPVFNQKVDEAKDDYGQALSKGQASADIKQVVRAAQQGRVGTLFVARGKQQWGVIQADENAVHLHDEQKAGDEDLLDYAALQTFSTGGSVFVLEPKQMPDGNLIAAIYRY